MSVFQTKEFARFARKAGLKDTALLKAAEAVANGDFDANLGGGVYKQRVARTGGGKSGGFRTLLLFKAGRHTFFVDGFAKNEKENIGPKEVKALKRLAAEILSFTATQIRKAEEAGELIELVDEDDGDEEEGEDDR